MIRIAAFLFATAVSFAAATYSYDSAGRLVKVDYGNGATITYAYDQAGNLLTRTVTSGASSTSSTNSKKKRKDPAKKHSTQPGTTSDGK